MGLMTCSRNKKTRTKQYQHTSHYSERKHGSGPLPLVHLEHLLLTLLFHQYSSLKFKEEGDGT